MATENLQSFPRTSIPRHWSTASPVSSTSTMTSPRLSPSPALSSSSTLISNVRHSPAPSLGPSVGKAFSDLQVPRMDPTDDERSWARHLMSEHCSKSSGFTHKDATAVLASIIRGKIPNATPGLVEALHAEGADVNWERRRSSNLVKMLAGRDQEDVRSRFLEDAIIHCSDGLVYALAMRSDQRALDRALPAAIRRNDVNKTSILLARGANAAPLCAEFLAAVDSCSGGVVDALLCIGGGVCQSCRDQGLVRSSASGQRAKAAMLLEKGASAVFDHAAALRAAIRGGSWDIADAILCRQELRSHQGIGLLDSAVAEAYAHGQHHILRGCLRAGARGPATDATLLKSIEHGRLELVEALTRHGASLDHQAGASVLAAIRSRNPQLLQAVLCGRPSQTTLMAAVDEFIMLKDVIVMHQMLGPLIASGLAGSDWAGMMLVHTLSETTVVGEREHLLRLVRLLAEKGRANVNVQNGRPLVLAAAKGWSDMLSLLLSCQPLLGSLQAALAPAMALANPELRLQVVELLVGAGRNRSAGDAESLRATAANLAAKCQSLDVLEHLAQSPLPNPVVLAGFSVAVSAAQWHTPRGLGVIRLLLHLGASGPEVDKAFCQAAQLYERDAFELMAPYVQRTISGEAFETVTQCSAHWLSPDNRNLWLIHSLLEYGARGGEQANIAFLRAVHAYVTGRSSEALVETFLTVGLADVNFKSGAALKMAVRAGNIGFFKTLLSHGANMETLAHAFHEAVIAPLDEDMALTLIDVLARGTTTVPDFKSAIPSLPSPMADCLAVHPESARLVTRLADLGCNPDGLLQAELYANFGPETCTPLLWALCPSTQRGRPISSAAIEALIKAQARTDFIAPLSKTTPLILAANCGRTDVVAWLIKAGADTRPRDCFDSSSLFYASREGFLDTVKVLLKSAFKPNDGSLHEAARHLHSEVVEALIKTGKHDVNYHSSMPAHGGRTPLQELAYLCDGTRNLIDMESTLRALKGRKASVMEKWQGKNVLFLALENKNMHPYPITRALLDIMMPQEISHEENVYEETETRYFYSPTMYLQKRVATLSTSKEESQRNWQLQQLLNSKNCPNRFYAGLGQAQPPGAVGIPDAIAKEDKRRQDEEEKRRKRQHEHEEELRRQDEVNTHRMMWDQSRHHVRQEHETEKILQQVHHTGLVHQARLRQQEEVARQQYQAAACKAALAEQAQVRAQQVKVQGEMSAQQLLARKHQLTLDFQHRAGEEKALQAAMAAKMAEADDRRRLRYQQQSNAEKVALQKTVNKLAKEDAKRKLEHRRDMARVER